MFNQAHHTQPKVIEYRILNHKDARKNKGWKTFCDVAEKYELTDESAYKIKREIEGQLGLFLSKIEVRLVG